MLIEKSTPIQTNDIVSIQTITGQEIVGKVVAYDSVTESVTLNKPLSINIAADPSGRPVVQMMPGMFMTELDSKQTFIRQHYIMIGRVTDDAKKAYIKNTTGLDITPTSLLKL